MYLFPLTLSPLIRIRRVQEQQEQADKLQNHDAVEERRP